MNNIFTCPICKDESCVPPSGKKTSPFLIVGEFPGVEETIKGRPMIGLTGKVLKRELGLLGVDINQVRLCNLWQHKPNGNEDCFKHGMEVVINEAKNKKVILLLGSDTVKCFTGENVSNVCGLTLVSSYLSAPTIIACVNPAIVFHSAIGELRLALKKFAKEVDNVSLERINNDRNRPIDY